MDHRVLLVFLFLLGTFNLGATARARRRPQHNNHNEILEGSGDDNEDDDDDDDPQIISPPPRRSSNLIEPTPALPPHFRPSVVPSGELLAGSGGGIPLVTPTPTFVLPPTTTSTAFPPRITRTYGKQILVAGVPFNLALNKSGHFHSLGDLELEAVDVPEWATFNGDVISGLPTNQDVSEYIVTVTALDVSSRLSVSQPLSLSVRQRQKSRLHNHFFTLEFNGNGSEVYGALSRFFGSQDIVIEKNDLAAPPYSTTWLFDSMLGSNSCPVSGLRDVYKKMVGPDGQLTGGFANSLKPHLVGVSVEVGVAGNCAGLEDEITGNLRTRPPSVNYPPSVKQIDEIVCEAGKLLVYKVPDSFCVDPEDPPSSLTLVLLDHDRRPAGASGWLQFDEKNKEFFGLPTQHHVGTHQFFLVCRDSGEKEASDALEVFVKSGAELDYGAEFSLHFDGGSTWGEIQKRRFIEKLASAFGSSTNQIKIRQLEEFQGTVHVKWVNASNPLGEQELGNIRKRFLSAEGGIDKRFLQVFQPEFTLLRATGSMVPLGPVIGAETPLYFEPEEPKLNIDDEGSSEVVVGEFAYVINFLLPAVLMALMVLVALTVACLLARNTRGRSLKEREALKATVPVILFGENEEEIQTNNKGRVWVHPREASPAPLPPSYSRESYAAPPPLLNPRGVQNKRHPHPPNPAPYIPP